MTLANTYASSVMDIGAGGIVFATSTTLKARPVSDYSVRDIRVAYNSESGLGGIAKSWNVALGVNNFTDRMPPLSPRAFTDNLADVSSYSPIGRLVYISAALKF